MLGVPADFLQWTGVFWRMVFRRIRNVGELNILVLGNTAKAMR